MSCPGNEAAGRYEPFATLGELPGAAGFPAAHWSRLGAHNAPDHEIMAFAKDNDYVVLTHDLDFSAILAVTHGEKPSVVQIRSEDVSIEAIGRSLRRCAK